MNFSSMKPGTKLISAFVAVYAISAVVSSIGIRDIGRINDEGDRVYQKDMVGLSVAKEAKIDLLYVGRSLRNAILSTNLEDRNRFLKAQLPQRF